MFRGREQAHPERGEALLRKLAEEIEEFGTIEQQPLREGRNMHMVLAAVQGPLAEAGREPASRRRPPARRGQSLLKSRPSPTDEEPKPAAAKPPAEGETPAAEGEASA